MAKIYSLDEQLDVLSDEQLEAIKQELLKDKAGNTEGKSVKSLIGRGITRGFADFSEGALLGFQGRPISEHSAFQKKTTDSDSYEELLKREQLKNLVDPSRRAAQLELDEIERKRTEQAGQPGQSVKAQDTGISLTPPSSVTSLQTSGISKEETPPMFIEKPKGKNKYGIMEYETIENPEYKTFQKKQESVMKESEPIGKDAAASYSGALQGLRDIKQIYEKLGLTPDGRIQDSEKAKDLIYRANLSIEGSGATAQGKGFTQFIPGAVGAYKSIKVTRGGDEGAELGNIFMTLAENQLRARTGAAAPEPEIVREYARSLLKAFIESPETWASKLNQVEQFLLGTAQSIKPTRYKEDLNQYYPGKSMESTSTSVNDPLGIR